MRFGTCLFAMMTFAGAAAADGPVYRTEMPAGGMDVIQPGYSLHTPGKGWVMTGSVKPENGVIRGWERFGPFVFLRGKRMWDDATIFVQVVRWPPWLTATPDLSRYLQDYDEMRGPRQASPGERFTVVQKTVNGAPCAVARSEVDKRLKADGPIVTAVDVRQICTHPEFDGIAVELKYSAGTTDDEAVFAAVADSLRFTPLPYRLREIRPGCVSGQMAEADGALWVSCQPADPNARGSLLRVDPATNTVVATIPLGTLPGWITAAFGAVWVGAGDDQIWRIDPKTNAVTDRIDLGGLPFAIHQVGDYLWVHVNRDRNYSYVRIDPAKRAVNLVVPLAGPAVELAAGKALFFLPIRSDVLHRLDPVTGKITAHAKLGEATQLLRFDGRFIRMAGLDAMNRPVLMRFDPQVPDAPPVIVARLPQYAHAWVEWNGALCITGDQSVLCFPGGDTEAPPREIPLALGAYGLSAFAGSLWVEGSVSSSITRIDPK